MGDQQDKQQPETGNAPAATGPSDPAAAAAGGQGGDNGDTTKSKDVWTCAGKGHAHGKFGDGRPGEPRSSSSECTSGESKTEKVSDQAGDGSLKDSGSQAGNEKAPNENSTERGGDDPANPEDSIMTGVTGGTENPDKSGDGDKPKLPRPEGTCPCPRCGSVDTKFCYYNNYNMKQPRYFCKGCQRYWTAGGMLRNVPVGSGRRSKSASRSAKKSEKSSMGSPPVPLSVMANPIGPGMAAPGAYAHNRHVLWDPADAGRDSPIPMMPEPYPGMTSGYVPPGVHPMYMSRVRSHGDHGAALGSTNQSNGSSLSSARSHLGGQDLMSSDTIGQGSSGELGPGAESPPDPAAIQNARTRGHLEGAPSIGVPKYMPPSAVSVPASSYDRALPLHPGFPRPSNDAVLGTVPPVIPKGYKHRAEPSGAEGHCQPTSQDAPWMMGTHPAAAAAAAAAYQAAAGQHHQPHYWPGLSSWPYPWGNSAAAGWAAAAAAVYHAGHAGSSNCWPPGPGWREGCAAPVGAMPSCPPSMPHNAQGMHPPNPMAAHNYSGQIMGYPGSNGGWPGWDATPTGSGSPTIPARGVPPHHASTIHSQPGPHAAPHRPRAAQPPGMAPGHFVAGGVPRGMPTKMMPGSGPHVRGAPGSSMLGKHPRAFNSPGPQ
mmetsp:Transcript_31940/g.90706  ORF Transcript_31940/g.90706 Transcript_31940/m.90706 type:complete len:654 (+) Transcript_31940:817-2778(+)